jgi:hypothetical protein
MSNSVNALDVNENLGPPTIDSAVCKLITDTADSVRPMWAEINAAEKFKGMARKLAPLKEQLLKTSRYNTTNIGWVEAFQIADFGCDRRTGDRILKIGQSLDHVGAIVPTCELPQHFGSLALFATLVLSPKFPLASLATYSKNGTIRPNSTVKEIRHLGLELGIIKTKKRTAKKPKEPVEAAINTLIKNWPRLSAEKHQALLNGIQKFIETIGEGNFRKVITPTVHSWFQSHFENQQQREKEAAKERAELAAFDRELGLNVNVFTGRRAA